MLWSDHRRVHNKAVNWAQLPIREHALDILSHALGSRLFFSLNGVKDDAPAPWSLHIGDDVRIHRPRFSVSLTAAAVIPVDLDPAVINLWV